MTRPDRQEHEIEIAASPDAVWKAITDAEELTRWFVMDARVEPGEGGTQWISFGPGMEATSTHLVWEPGVRLRLGKTEPDLQGWDAVVHEYTIETRGGTTHLRLVQSGMPTGPDWDEAYDGTNVGWRLFFTSLKFYLENHAGVPRRTIFRYGPVSLAPDALWKKMTGPEMLAAAGDLTGLKPGSRYAATTSDGQSMEGEVLLYDPGRNFSVTVEGWNNAILSFDLFGSSGKSFTNFMLGTFGLDDATFAALDNRWASLLDVIMPRSEPKQG